MGQRQPGLPPRELVPADWLPQFGDIVCLWAALQIVNARLSVAALVLAYSGGYVLTRRSLPAGGAGVVEIALTCRGVA